ncbi:hypothetical protein DFP72DRAFT_1130783 [Ephemerocybe angulata]|uniref:Nephrocystin 3-like N-terminal domain-containing protein n=1 Tax=Ephemerocybe angulata TaxID=980116 RepID=A0A8H6HUU8_9AGAR|nr:hypothetical protein DFP72DRAFT_1130783 [Tulosesus angulatus]
MNPGLHVARGSADHMDVDQPQGGPQVFSGASNITARDITVHTAGRDMINNIIVNPAPISASIEEVTAWLKGANFRAIYRVSLEARMDNTGTWFIATFEFGEFVRQKGTVVWATGLPGSGKTILASISIEHLEDRFSGRTDIAIVYAFLRYSEKPSLLQIIAGLLTQLVSCHKVAFSHLFPSYQRAKMHRDELPCSEAVRLLKSVLGLFSDTFIVIDGLDEVDDTTKDGLLDVLTSLHAHILLTCRPLELFMRRHTPSALQIPVQAQTRDIEVYVAKRIKQSTRLFSILSENPNIAERFTAIIQEKSKGMFLLARLQLELVLERCTTIGSLLKALETLPSGINDMYRLTMERISSLSEEEVSLAHRTFLWILHAKEDLLSSEDLQHALTFSYEAKEFVEDSSVSIPVLLSICCGLVTVEDKQVAWLGKIKVIRFIRCVASTCFPRYHLIWEIDYSTQEFMKGLAFPHLPGPHDLLAVTSVACVEIHMPMVIAALKSAERNSVYTSDVTQHLPLLRYALVNWGAHAKICDDQWSLNPFIHSDFLSKHRAYPVVKPSCSNQLYLSEVSTGLHAAAAYDVVNLISSRILPYSPTHGTKTPFHVAAEHGNISALSVLLKNYSGVHVRDETGQTPLHYCGKSEGREIEVARQLLNLSPSDSWRAFPLEIVDINAQDEDGHSAFFEACSNVWGPSIEPLNDEGRILRLFLSHPAIDVDLPDSNRDTPFSRACSFENSHGVAQFLLFSHPNLKVDIRNKWGETPFMHACNAGSETVVNWFLSHDPGGCYFHHQEDDEGNTALEQVVAYEGFATARNREGRSTFNLRDYQGTAGLLEALEVCLREIEPIIRILSQHASYVRMVRAGHESLPIYQLRTSRPQESPRVHVCLNNSHRRYEGARTSLMILASYPAAVNYLVSENGDNPDFINAQDTDGRCALMYVCFGQDPEGAEFSVRILTSCPSIDIHLRDRDGMSALDYALRSENFNAQEILLDHPSWNHPTIRSVVIAATQNGNTDPEALWGLLDIQSVQDAFAEAVCDRRDVCALKTALRRRGDCEYILEDHTISGIFWYEEQEDHNREEYPDRPTPAAIRQATIAAVNNPLTSIEQLESHFGQKEVKDAFVWDIDVRLGAYNIDQTGEWKRCTGSSKHRKRTTARLRKLHCITQIPPAAPRPAIENNDTSFDGCVCVANAQVRTQVGERCRDSVLRESRRRGQPNPDQRAHKRCREYASVLGSQIPRFQASRRFFEMGKARRTTAKHDDNRKISMVPTTHRHTRQPTSSACPTFNNDTRGASPMGAKTVVNDCVPFDVQGWNRRAPTVYRSPGTSITTAPSKPPDTINSLRYVLREGDVSKPLDIDPSDHSHTSSTENATATTSDVPLD